MAKVFIAGKPCQISDIEIIMRYIEDLAMETITRLFHQKLVSDVHTQHQHNNTIQWRSQNEVYQKLCCKATFSGAMLVKDNFLGGVHQKI